MMIIILKPGKSGHTGFYVANLAAHSISRLKNHQGITIAGNYGIASVACFTEYQKYPIHNLTGPLKQAVITRLLFKETDNRLIKRKHLKPV